VPDEARTFGMESLFRKIGIYSHVGQNYEPVDRSSLLYYKEATDGQILEEGITEAGSMASFIAAGTAYSTFDINMVPFFFFYSMFGFQRIGDMIWAAGDIQARGFLLGATAGRTTLAGEGLQHQDGNSHILALPNPSLLAYDPAFAFEIAVIVREGLRRMLEEGEKPGLLSDHHQRILPMPAMPAGTQRGHPQGDLQVFPLISQKSQRCSTSAGQRRHPQRMPQSPGHPGSRLWRRRRRLECHQL
jgi:pyruvate dehydrogenase E1 component